jgi:transcriptional regulator with XRE-family HTH domain
LTLCNYLRYHVAMTQNQNRPSRVVGRQVKRLRERQGISAQRLADRCAELGAPAINRSVVANIESRREAVSVDELMVLAAALNTPPMLLVAPLGDEQKVAVTPKTVVHPHLLLDWMTGDAPLCNTNRTARTHPWSDEGAPDWREASLPIWMFRQLGKYQDMARLADVAWLADVSAPGADDAFSAGSAANRDKALRALAQHIEVMDRSGLAVPEMPTEWRARMAELAAEDEEG